MALEAQDNPFPYVTLVETADPTTPAAGTKRVWLDTDGILKEIDEAATVAPLAGDVGAHLADTGDAHDASAISIVDAGTHYTGTDVEAALQEVPAMIAAGAGGGIVRADVDWSTLASDTTLGANWAAVDAATDLVLAVTTGDIIETKLDLRVGDTVNAQAFFDVYSIVSSAPVNSLGLGTAAPSGTSGVGVIPLVADPSQIRNQSASMFYAVQAGDIDGGNITMRWYARRSSANRSLSGGSRFSAKNWGQ